MSEHSVAYVGLDTSKLHNAVAIAEAGRDGEVRYRRDRQHHGSDRAAGTQALGQARASGVLLRSRSDRVWAVPSAHRAGPRMHRGGAVVDPAQAGRSGEDQPAGCAVAGEAVARQRFDGGVGARPAPRGEARAFAGARGGATQWICKAKGQQVSSLLLRLGRHYPRPKTWGKAHLKWLAEQKLEHLEQRLALEEMLLAVRQATDRVQRLEQAIRAAVPDWSLAPLVTALMALRGSTTSPRRRCWPRSAICRGSARRAS